MFTMVNIKPEVGTVRLFSYFSSTMIELQHLPANQSNFLNIPNVLGVLIVHEYNGTHLYVIKA